MFWEENKIKKADKIRKNRKKIKHWKMFYFFQRPGNVKENLARLL